MALDFKPGTSEGRSTGTVDAKLIQKLMDLFGEKERQILYGNPLLGSGLHEYTACLKGVDIELNVSRYGLGWALSGFKTYTIDRLGSILRINDQGYVVFNPYVDERFALHRRWDTTGSRQPTNDDAGKVAIAFQAIIDREEHLNELQARQASEDALTVPTELSRQLMECFRKESEGCLDGLSTLPPKGRRPDLYPTEQSSPKISYVKATWKDDRTSYAISEYSLSMEKSGRRRSEYYFSVLGLKDLDKLKNWVDTLPEGITREELVSSIEEAQRNYATIQKRTVKRAWVIADRIFSQEIPLEAAESLRVNKSNFTIGDGRTSTSNPGERSLLVAIRALKDRMTKDGISSIKEMGIEGIGKFLVSYACSDQFMLESLLKILEEAPDFKFVGWSLNLESGVKRVKYQAQE